MEDVYKSINELMQELLIPARTEKKIDLVTFDKFYNILLYLENKVRGEEYIPRKIAGLLFFIYTSLAAEAINCNYKDELFIAVAKLEDLISKILWDSPIKN